MRRKPGKWVLASKIVSASASVALVFSLAPAAAFADEGAKTAKEADGQIIAAAYAAANPAPEILGLDNPNQRSAEEAETTYKFFGDDAVNKNPDPYLYNTHYKLTPGVTIGGRQGSPMSALNAYDTTDSSAAQNKVWELLPHIVLGTGGDAYPNNDASKEHDFYIDRGDAAAVEKAKSLEEGSYKPIAVTYNRNSLPTMIQTMYRLASAANEVAEADKSLKARYEDPMEIAKDFERYIVGQKGLVKQAIDTGKVKQKTIALVESYDSDAKAYTLITDGVAEGTATTNRYLEAVQGVSTNYYDTAAKSAKDAKSVTVTADQLKENVDVIIIGGNAGTESGTLADYLAGDGLLDKTYYCVNWASGSAFGTTVNSVENAQNVGRILPCVYPEVLDQSDMIAYYYDKFYHVKSGKTAELIAERMDGVRNWDKKDSASYTAWEQSDVGEYNLEQIESSLKTGISYLNEQSGLSDYLKPTTNLAQDSANLEDAQVSVPAGVLQDGKAEPEPTVVYKGTTLVKDKDYTLAWSNNTSVETEGTVTVTAIKGSGYTGSKSATFKILSTANFTEDAVTVADVADQVYTGKAIEPAVSVTWKDGNKTLALGTDYKVSYSNNVNVAAKDAQAAPTVTIEGLGDYAGTIVKTFAITQKTVTIAVPTDGTNISGKKVGDSFALSATAEGYDGTLKYVAGDDGVTVSSMGTVTVAKAGTHSVTISGEATANCSKPADVTVNITAEKGDVAFSLQRGMDKASKAVGDAPYTFTAEFSKVYDGTVTCKSSDEKVATAALKQEAGKATVEVTVVSPGTATITITAPNTDNWNEGTATSTVTVAKGTVAITAADVTKQVGDAAFDLGATASKGYDGTLSYKSSDGNVAQVDATGKVTVKAVGTATIEITAPATELYNEATKTVTVTVNKKAQAATTKKAQTITAADKSVAMGKTVALAAKTNGGGALSYASSNNAIAKVDASGKVTPVKVGTATITIKAAAKGDYAAATKTVKVQVTAGVQTVTFNKQTKKLTAKKLKKAKQGVAITKASGSKTAITYSIAKVNKLKKNFTINKKTGKITVKKGTKKGKYLVSVKAAAGKNANWKAASKTAVITIQVK